MKTNSSTLANQAHPRDALLTPTSVNRTLRRWLTTGAALSLLLCAGMAQATTYTVNTTADSGPGSLRQAILDANSHAGADRIVFSGSFSIQPLSTLPNIAEALELDGSGHLIDLNASGLPLGLEINSGNCTIRGLNIHSAAGSGIIVRHSSFNLAEAEYLIAHPETVTASGLISEADLFGSGSAGRWSINHPIPGGGGDYYAFSAVGQIDVATEGDYTFALGSDDGGRLLIDGVEVVSYPFPRGFDESFGSVYLTAGAHSVEWIGFEVGGGAGFELSVAPAGTPFAIVVGNLAQADALIASPSARTESVDIDQADLVDASDPAPGHWVHDNPIPGGGGDNYAFSASGTINVATAGNYYFALGSDDGGRLRIDETTVVEYLWGRAFGDSLGEVYLTEGPHSVEWVGFESSYETGFELSVAAAGASFPVNAANGWHVLGDPAPSTGIALDGPLHVTAYYYPWHVLGALNPSTGISLVGPLAVTVYYQDPNPLENILIESDVITDNYGINGSGIYNEGGSITVQNCTISRNVAIWEGGGINNARGSVIARNCTVSHNFAIWAGGGIYSSSDMGITIENCVISENRAGDANNISNGGGILSQGGTVSIINSTISRNEATLSGGGIDSSSTLSVKDTTISGNRANTYLEDLGGRGGGIRNRAGLTLVNTTISGNTAHHPGGRGGGTGQMNVNNSTFSDNEAGTGGGISNGGITTMKNSIVANSLSGGNIANLGGFNSLGYNLSDDTSAAGILTATGDQNNAPALLGPLQDNGGSTMTHALLAGSPAIDQGDAAFDVSSLPYDQRQDGFVRVSNCRLDIGAYEVQMVVTITGPASGSIYAVGTPVPFTGNFTDPRGGSHTATWTIDGINYSGVVSQTPDGTTGTVTGTIPFPAPGVYSVQLTVQQNDCNRASADTVGDMPAMVVIYDPNAGFVTGGGWINSPAGAAAWDSTLTGKATFGFVSKYKKGMSVPTGETEFQFKAGDLNFKSTSYDWLVVSGARAQYKGTGIINGAGSYGFMLTAIDGQISGGGGSDKFRVKIWDKPTGDVYYDNQMGADDGATPSTVIGGGSIVIRK